MSPRRSHRASPAPGPAAPPASADPACLPVRRRGWLDSPPLRLAVEIAAGAILAARARPGGGDWEAAAAKPLPAGALQPGLTATNLADPAALTAVLRHSLEAVGGVGRDAALLLPDAAFRVALLDFDEIPRHAQELEALVRFRLRKTLPFDADTAALAAEVLRSGPRRAVVAVLADRARLDEYEDAFAAAGGRAAILMPAGLAALMALPGFGQGALLLRWHGGALTSGFGWEDLPRLYRVVVASELSYDDLHPSAAFFRDFHESPAAAAPAAPPPRIWTFGLPAALAAQLRQECPWAQIRPGAAALGVDEAFVALAGVLRHATAGAASAGPAATAPPPEALEDARASGAGLGGAQ